MDNGRKPRRVLERGITFALFATACLTACAAPAQTAEARSTTLQGRLVNIPGAGPALRTKDKEYRLAARTDWLLHTLADKRLENHEVRLEGTLQPGGTLKVNHLYTVRDGRLFRVRYFCEICNIEALEPGNCVCCQQPTELQEIPIPEK